MKPVPPGRRSGYAALAVTLAMLAAFLAMPTAGAAASGPPPAVAAAATVANVAANGASPAVALASRPSSCPQYSYVCGYVNSTYQTNQGYEIDPALAPGTCDTPAYNNAWSSIWNSGPRNVRFYQSGNCTGSYKLLEPNSGVNWITPWWGKPWDNSISSFRFM